MRTKVSYSTQKLVGEYQKISKYAYQNINSGIILHVGRNYRSKRTDKVLLYYDAETKKTRHISSLMPAGNDKFYFDTYDKYYVISFNDHGAEIIRSQYTKIVSK